MRHFQNYNQKILPYHYETLSKKKVRIPLVEMTEELVFNLANLVLRGLNSRLIAMIDERLRTST